MGHLSFIDIVGAWLGIFLTFAILSFLYKDNPVYKLAEHLFIGVSIGYVVTLQYYTVLERKLVQPLAEGRWWYAVALLFSLALLAKAGSRRLAWVGRYPIAFVVAFYAAIQVNGVARSDLAVQIQKAVEPLHAPKVDINTAEREELLTVPAVNTHVADAIIERRAREPLSSVEEIAALAGLLDWERADLEEVSDGWFGGHINGLPARVSFSRPAASAGAGGSETDRRLGAGGQWWFGLLSKLLMLLGLAASLVYFYFSVAHRGAVGKVSRFGVWTIMIGFGAAFGFTAQGRLALAVGRGQDILGRLQSPIVAAQIHGAWAAVASILLIVIGLVVWERLRRRDKSAKQ